MATKTTTRKRLGHGLLVGLVGSIIILGTVATLSRAMKPANTVSGRLVASQASTFPFVLNGTVTVYGYTAPTFTWMSPVTFNFSIFSLIDVVVFINVTSDALQHFLFNQSVTAGLKFYPITVSLNPITVPGEHSVNVSFSYNLTTASFSCKLWVGSNIIIAGVMFFGVLGIALAIFARYGPTKKPSTSGTGSIGSAGTSSTTSDDDTSTATYVDQSRAPAGRIFCPECKKVIEEGSIFCPECGTRIPRYLRYHP